MTLLLDERRRAMLRELGLGAALPPQAAAAEAAPIVIVPPERPVAPPRPAAAEEVRARIPESAEGPRGPVAVPAQPLQPRVAGVEALGWDELQEAVAACRACKLCAGRRNTVFGVGDRQADWMVVGEAPGENEDREGEPFVGQAGKLLDNMLAALALSRRERVYIANVLKCRPPGNRNPEPDEVAQCEPFLRRQVALVQPRIILAMGRFAVQTLLQSNEPIGKLRGRIHSYAGVPVVVTYHPAYLLRNLPDKAKAWADLCLARAQLRQD